VSAFLLGWVPYRSSLEIDESDTIDFGGVSWFSPGVNLDSVHSLPGLGTIAELIHGS